MREFIIWVKATDEGISDASMEDLLDCAIDHCGIDEIVDCFVTTKKSWDADSKRRSENK